MQGFSDSIWSDENCADERQKLQIAFIKQHQSIEEVTHFFT